MKSLLSRHACGALCAALIATLAVGAFGSASPSLASGGGIDWWASYSASIRRTEAGVPHIKANDYASLGFGTGYVVAEDNFCLLMDEFVTLAAERSLYHGPDGGNVESDFFYQLLLDRNLADNEIPEEYERVYQGWAAGFNRYLRDVGGADGIDDPACQGAEWIREISTREVKHLNQIDFFLSGFSGFITNAAPPEPPPLAELPMAAGDVELAFLVETMGNPHDKGSNGVAIGRDATEDGTGMLFTNPHLGWAPNVNRRFYPFHQIIPGELNNQGANIISRAQTVGFGTNGDVAWTNTVSTSERFQFYLLFLAPGETTSYMFDGVPTPMTTEEVTVTVRNSDGSLEERSHVFYSTHFGWMIEAGFFPWGENTAYALRFASVEDRGAPGGFALSQSRDIREFKSALDQYQNGTGNFVAVDREGEALYTDSGPMANFPDYKTDVFFCDFGGVIDGSRSDCQWDTDPDAVAPGIYGPSNQPFLFRTDYVTNSNDSHWLANPAEPLTGFNRNIGNEDGERTLRTRSGLRMVRDRLDGSDGLGAPGFSLEQLQALMLSNQHEAGGLLRDDLVALCMAEPLVTLPDGTDVDLTAACSALASWDVTAERDSRGSHVMREFLREANGGRFDRWLPSSLTYAVPFDPADPIGTPRGIDPVSNDDALEFLGQAVKKLSDAGLALDARLGDLQSVTRNGERIEIHGGEEGEGVFNKVSAAFQGSAGYPEVTGSSSSWIMATEFTEEGPVNRGFLTYSISANPNSPHFSDFTKRYSDKDWVDLPYFDEDVEAAALSTVVIKDGIWSCRRNGWKDFTEPSFDTRKECFRYFKDIRRQRKREIRDRQHAGHPHGD